MREGLPMDMFGVDKGRFRPFPMGIGWRIEVVILNILGYVWIGCWILIMVVFSVYVLDLGYM